MREPWPEFFPPVFVHTHFDAGDRDGVAPGLSDHAEWLRAKRGRNARAAVRLIEDVFCEETLERLHDATVDFQDQGILVVAPAATPSESNNALAITYAQWLGREMGWDVEERIFQKKDFSKDGSNFWYRIGLNSEFYGNVEPGRPYVLVDDVFTLGGTLADLRGFVIQNGGNVIAMSALAHRSGSDVQIALADDTLFGLQSRFGSTLDALCVEEFGYGSSSLTEPEGRRFLGFASADEIRARIYGARDRGDAR